MCAYAPAIPTERWDVAVINPPYGLWWPVTDTPLAEYELATAENIESQNLVLELATRLLFRDYDRGGLLLAILSGRFWNTYPKAAEYVKRNYQVVTALNLPKLFNPEYEIDVDAAFLVVASTRIVKVAAPLTGTFEGTDSAELTRQVVDAFKNTVGVGRRYEWQQDVFFLPKRNYASQFPEVPELDMALQVETDRAPLRLTVKGARPQGEWAGLWTQFYAQTPLETYNPAQGTNTDLIQAFAALPNVLMAGSNTTEKRLRSLGLDMEMTVKDSGRIALAAKRYRRDRLPVRELAPMEYLAWYEDRPITAKESVTVPQSPQDEGRIGSTPIDDGGRLPLPHVTQTVIYQHRVGDHVRLVICPLTVAPKMMVTGSAAVTSPHQVTTPPASLVLPDEAHRFPRYVTSAGRVSVTRTFGNTGPGFSNRMV